MTLSIFQRVYKFNEDAGTKMGQQSLDSATAANEVAMLQEELDELKTAFADNNRIEQADALADLAYVVMGAMGKLGFDFEQVMNEVCRSNETKYQGGVLVKNAEGKIQKGSSFEQPNLSFVSEPALSPLKQVYSTGGTPELSRVSIRFKDVA